VGFQSQCEIEQSVKNIGKGELNGTEKLEASILLEVFPIRLKVIIDDVIKLG